MFIKRKTQFSDFIIHTLVVKTEGFRIALKYGFRLSISRKPKRKDSYKEVEKAWDKLTEEEKYKIMKGFGINK